MSEFVTTMGWKIGSCSRTSTRASRTCQRGHVDVAAGGAFLSLTIDDATTLIEKMVANQI
jgi:hypothetical protein